MGERVLADPDVGVTKTGFNTVGCRVWMSTEELEPREPARSSGTMDGGVDESSSTTLRAQSRIEGRPQESAATSGIYKSDERQHADQRRCLDGLESFGCRLGHLRYPIRCADHTEPRPQRFGQVDAFNRLLAQEAVGTHRGERKSRGHDSRVSMIEELPSSVDWLPAGEPVVGPGPNPRFEEDKLVVPEAP